MRSILLLAFGLALFVALPTASAQAVMTISAEWERSTYELSENGRGDVPLIVHATIVGTNCAQEQTYTVKVKLASFSKWGGASLLPPQVTFKVPAGPIVAEQRLPDQETLLNLAWNLDDAPRKGAVQEYVAIIRGDDVTKSGGPCLPDPRYETADSEPLRVTLADRLVADPDVSCLDDPMQEKCVSTSAPPENPVPSAGPLVLLIVIGMATIVRRRFGSR
ncbi:MAG TPA: hypothetical protein VGB18_05600 [Candidatus Thermoplasmatota archaeon]